MTMYSKTPAQGVIHFIKFNNEGFIIKRSLTHTVTHTSTQSHTHLRMIIILFVTTCYLLQDKVHGFSKHCAHRVTILVT